MKKYYILFLIILIISIITNILLLIYRNGSEISFSYKRTRDTINLPLIQSASCNFENDVSVDYKSETELVTDKKIKFEFSSNIPPVNISFIDLDKDKPIMRGNAGQSNLIKLVDNSEVVTVIEADPILFGTLQSFTIFKNTGVGIWTKQYNLASQIPFGLISMGYCD